MVGFVASDGWQLSCVRACRDADPDEYLVLPLLSQILSCLGFHCHCAKGLISALHCMLVE